MKDEQRGDAAVEDCALGAAWRRCEAALPEGAHWGVERDEGAPRPFTAWTESPDYISWGGPTPTAALEALAEALEARRGE